MAAIATAILQRLRVGTVPCDGAWPPNKVAAFARWVEAGTPQPATSQTPISPGATQPDTAAADEMGAGDQDPIAGRLGQIVQLRSGKPDGDKARVIEHREPLIYMLCTEPRLELMAGALQRHADTLRPSAR